MAGYIFAFEEDLGLSGGQFALIWMIGWLYLLIPFKLTSATTTISISISIRISISIVPSSFSPR